MEIVYGVEWIEVEFGQRPEGYKIFVDKDECIRDTLDDSYDGPYGGGYIGPSRSPFCYYEIPLECLEDKVKIQLSKGCLYTFSTDFWEPKFKKAYMIPSDYPYKAKAEKKKYRLIR